MFTRGIKSLPCEGSKINKPNLLLPVLVATALGGCAMQPMMEKLASKPAQDEPALPLPGQTQDVRPTLIVHDGPYLQLHKVSRPDTPPSEESWLKSRRVTLHLARPVSAAEIAKMLRDQGFNIASSLPLGSYTYSGLGVSNVDGETAFQMLFGAMGLDYEVDNKRQVVTIEPLATRTWQLNLGHRTTKYSSGTLGGSSGSSEGSGGSTSGGSGNSGGSQGGGQGGNSSNSSSGGSSNGGSTVGSNTLQNSNSRLGINQSEDFWSSLNKEIKARLTVLVPAPRSPAASRLPQLPPRLPELASSRHRRGHLPALPPLTPMTDASASTEAPREMFVEQKFGLFSTNPETGTITVQAPRWLLNKIDAYLKDVQAMYNADITFQGELVMLNTDRTDQEGIDITGFARFAHDRYHAIYSNNALGGVTVQFPNGTPGSVNPGSSGALPLPLNNPLLGAAVSDSLQVFNAYLSSKGSVNVLQKPLLSTTSGVPGEFSKTHVLYYNMIAQQATAGNTGSAVVATTNTLVPVELGTILRINPRYDVKQNLIRAQISLQQDVQSGSFNFQQVASGMQPIPTQVPLVTKLNYSGEALLHDGDLIIIGGMHDDQSDSNESGVPGLKDSFIGGLFGTRQQNKHYSTYYFALRVSVTKK